MDDADRGSELEEAHRQEALAKRRPSLIACGACHYCGEALDPAKLFCDHECTAEYDRERAIREAQGR